MTEAPVRTEQRARRRTGVKLGVVAAGGALGVVAAPLSSSPAAAAQGPIAYTQNIAGAAVNIGNVVALNYLKATVLGYDNAPLAIGLQETCQNQMNDFKNFLRTNKGPYYSVFRVQANPTGSCGTTEAQQYGIAAYAPSNVNIYIDGPTQAERVKYYHFPTQAQFDEDRGAACMKAAWAGTNHWSCTAHMYFDNPSTSFNQFSEYKQFFIDPRLASGYEVFWGGDIYTSPLSVGSVPGWSWSNNREAQNCIANYPNDIGFDPTSASGKTNDYVFRSPVNYPCKQDAFEWPPPNQFGTYLCYHPPAGGSVCPDPTGWYRSDHATIGLYDYATTTTTTAPPTTTTTTTPPSK